jgi:hypothetical protein
VTWYSVDEIEHPALVVQRPVGEDRPVAGVG